MENLIISSGQPCFRQYSYMMMNIESYAPSYFSKPKSKGMKQKSPEPSYNDMFIVHSGSKYVRYLFCVTLSVALFHMFYLTLLLQVWSKTSRPTG